jgi:hypothetical protein
MLHGAFHWKAIIYIYYFKKFQKIQNFIEFAGACLQAQKVDLAILVF